MRSPSRVLVISSLGEPCTALVVSELKRMGSDVLIVNYEEAVLKHHWTIDLTRGSRQSDLLSFDPNAVWIRRWGYPIYPAAFNNYSIAFSFSEITSFVAGLPSVLSDVFWLNHPDNERLANNKVRQLSIAQSIGLTIPETIITNNYEEVLAFKKKTGRIIFKAVSASQIPIRRFNKAAFSQIDFADKDSLDFGEKIEASYIYTRELTDDMLKDIGALKWSPAIFQRRIDKEYDIRTTYVCGQFFSCAIESQINPDTSTDFRMMNISGSVPHRTIILPEPVENMLKQMMNIFGLEFGCIDLIKDVEGNYVFLEINPSGQWLWVEQMTGMPITAAVASALSVSERVGTNDRL